MGRTRIVEAMIPVEATADGGVPTEFRLLKSGINTYADGDQILFDDDAAEETLKRYRARGIDLMADYEHMSLARPPQPAPASAKKWVPEVRGGDLMATNIAWTEKAKSMLAAGEYRYFSIACKVDAKSNRCVELINFALTNTPAADGIAPLVAASRNHQTDEDDMKTVIVALGLSAETAENEAVAAASRLKEFSDEACSLLKVKSITEAKGALRAVVEAKEQVVTLTAELAKVKTEQRCAAFDALVKQGQDGRQLSPAMAKGEWIAKMRAREDGVEELKSFLATAPKLVEGAKDAPREEHGGGSADISDMEIKIAKSIVGNDPVKLKKHLEDLRAYKAARASNGAETALKEIGR